MKLIKNVFKTHYPLLILLLASIIVIFSFISLRDLWTQEHRWADIVSGMFYRHDFLHPFLDNDSYYDKPLLSYWLIVFAASILGKLSLTALRLPSAFAALIAIIAIYRIGTTLHSKRLGLLAGWMLVTTFYFLFWARTSSADMLNLAGILVAFYWYVKKRDNTTFLSYAVFFMILAVTSLCKGLTGAVVPLLSIFPDLIRGGHFRKHVNWKLVAATLPAILVYFLPFWASVHFGGQDYSNNGLTLVYRENIMRYFQPFDHKDPVYTYFIFLPVYLLPWTLFFIPALASYAKRLKTLSWNSRWIFWVVIITFLFFTLSGSRRNYYILSMVPFGILMTADWIISAGSYREKLAGIVARLFFVLYLIYFLILQPVNYVSGGVESFIKNLKASATATRSWDEWQLILLDPKSSLRFYLHLPPTHLLYSISNRDKQTLDTLLRQWPMLCQQNGAMIFITRQQYRQPLSALLTGYLVIDTPPTLLEKLTTGEDGDESSFIAYIPTANAHCIHQ